MLKKAEQDASVRKVYIMGTAVIDPHLYRDNRIKTSKYTFLTFLPKNLVE